MAEQKKGFWTGAILFIIAIAFIVVPGNLTSLICVAPTGWWVLLSFLWVFFGACLLLWTGICFWLTLIGAVLLLWSIYKMARGI